MKPSIQKRLDLIESGKKTTLYIGKFPLEMGWDKEVKQMVMAEIERARVLGIEPNHVENPNKDGLKRYKVYDNDGTPLAYFYNSKASLDGAVDIHYISWVDKDSWYGCRGVNTSDGLEFESCNEKLNMVKGIVINEKGKTVEIPRYCRITIKLDRYKDVTK